MQDTNTPSVRDFTNLRFMAEGGFAQVYAARQVSIDRDVALKVLRADAGQDDDRHARRQFAHELRLMGELGSHPHLVAVFAAGQTDDDRPFVAMELLDGSYADLMSQHGPLDSDEVLAVGRSVAAALARAHHHDTIHRDVKPDNVLRQAPQHPGDRLRIALADFGIARDVRRTDHSRTLDAMSFTHAAPEVLRGGNPTRAADIYSLGSTLYALLAGVPAFPRQSDEGDLAYIQRILAGTVSPIDRRDVPADLVAAIEAMMARDPADRVPSAQEVLSRLDGIGGSLDRVPPLEGGAIPPSLPPTPPTDHSAWMPGGSTAPPDQPAPGPVAPAPPSGPAPVAAPAAVGGLGPGGASGLAPAAAASDSATGHLPTAGRPGAPPPAPGGVGGLAPGTGTVPEGDTGYLPPGEGKVDAGPVEAPAATRGVSTPIKVLIGAAALLLAGVLALVVFGGGGGDTDEVGDTTLPPEIEQVTPALAPTDLEAEDQGAVVILTWTNNLPRDVQYLVTWAGDDGTRPEEPIISEVGEYRVEVGPLDPDVGYCFTVTTIGSSDTALASNPTCIRGAQAADGPTGTTTTTAP